MLSQSISPAIDVRVVMDRTQTIRASVRDVEKTLLITIALVVMVVFLFLRRVWATVIPSVAVPLSLVGTFGVMYLCGYSIDNLSLMALTISTGFVVDDAIVMIENITRFIELGHPPFEAALLGAKQIGFTIVSITVSLIAVFTPILLMGGLVGRLFREFAVTLSVAIAVSALVSLTLTPMLCARFLRSEKGKKEGRVGQVLERLFNGLHSGYEHGLKFVLRHRFLTLCVAIGTLVLTVILYIIVPKGFFPQQDNGLLAGFSEASQDISFAAMKERQEAINAVAQQDQAIDHVNSFIGSANGSAGNTGFVFIALKPLANRVGHVTADQIINRLRPKLAKVEGITLYLQAIQDVRVGGRTTRTQYQYAVEDADLAELNLWAPKLVERLKKVPSLRDVATDQQTAGLQATLRIDRDTASRLGVTAQLIDDTLYDAFGQRQVATTYTQLNQYHVILEVKPELQLNPDALNAIYVPTPNDGQVPLSTFTHFEPTGTSLSVNHQGQFPAVTLSFNLAPGVALGDAVVAINAAEQEIGLPGSIHASFQGTAQAFQASLKSEPMLILAALVTVYIVLGVLYESLIHPITILSTLPSAGVGALLMLMVTKTEFSIIALIGIILLIGIVKKNAIMMIDFALEAERVEGLSPIDSIYKACMLRFRPIMMTTMAALLGGLPLALGTGTGSELRRPLGISIVGGLIISQMLTLFTTPVVYLYLDKFSPRRRKSAATAGKAAAPAIAG
jgi:multidrug efflux pump